MPRAVRDETTARRSLRLLIVEDSAIVSTRLVAAVEGFAGIASVDVARDGAEAQQAFGGAGPDVVLLDLQLPDISGLDLLRRYKVLHPAGTVLVLTSFAFAQLRARCQALGADGFFDKVFEFDRAIEVIRHLGQAAVTGPEGATL